MSYEGKDTILRVVRDEAERMFALAEAARRLGARRPPCEGWRSRDIVGHIVDTTEGYFKAFDAARGRGEVADAVRAARHARAGRRGRPRRSAASRRPR